MKHNIEFLVRLWFRLHSWCAKSWYFQLMWSWSFTLTSPSSNAYSRIQHIIDSSKSSKASLVKFVSSILPISRLSIFQKTLKCDINNSK